MFFNFVIYLFSRPGVSIHTMSDHKSTPPISGGFFSTTPATTTAVMGGNFHPTTINNLDQHQGVFKTHNCKYQSSYFM